MAAYRIALATLAVFLLGIASAQPTFIRTYEQPDLDIRGWCTTPDDGLVLTGTSGPDGFLMRLDRYGNVGWLKTYSSIGVNFVGTYTGEPYDFQEFNDVVVLPNGDLFVTGSATLDIGGALSSSKLMARFDSLGTPSWARTIQNSDTERLTSAVVVDPQTVIVGGVQNTLQGSSALLYTVDLDSGIVTRSFYYDDLGYAGTFRLALSPDSAVLVMIGSDGGGDNLRKMSPVLSTIWERCYSGAWWPMGAQGLPGGRTIALGPSGIVRYDPAGVQVGASGISIPSGFLRDFVLRPNGNMVLLGYSSIDQCSYLTELDSSGVLQWSARYGAPGDTIIMGSVRLLSDGSLRMLGRYGYVPAVIAVDPLGQLDACAPLPVTVTFGTVTTTTTASGTVTIWGSTPLSRHEELPTVVYNPLGTLLCAGTAPGYQATGLSYIDLDQDGQPGPNENAAPWQLVNVSPNSGGIYTAYTGTYQFVPQDSGSFVLSAPVPSPLWQLSSDSASYTVHLGNLNPAVDSLDFGWAPVTDSTVISASVIPGDLPCVSNGMAFLSLLNQGTTRPDLLVAFTLDPILSIYSATPLPDSIVGNTLYWHVDSMSYFSDWQASVSVPFPGLQFLGDSTHNTLAVFEIDSLGTLAPVATQPWDNIITCGYDPNDKYVEPAGSAPLGGIPPDTEWLTYTVRFQNTGNDTAHTVVIEDHLSVLLQWGTFQVIGASHTLTGISMSPFGKVVFRFDNIMLPDSGADQSASNGFVRFRVKPVPGLAHQTTIDNDAGIFFDLNPPVITNTVRNTIIDCTGSDFGIQMMMVGGDLLAMNNQWFTNTYTYQWYLNQVPIPGAAFSYLEQPQQFGDYMAVLTDNYGCTDTASYSYYATSVPSSTTVGMTVFPNPVVDGASISLSTPLRPEEVVTLLDIQGRIVRTLRGNGTNTIQLDRGDLAPGLYMVRITDHGAVRFVVE